MNTPVETVAPQPPSTRRIAAAAGVAAVVAAIVLVAVVLPAEYGVDPLGTGKALGLLDLYSASSGAQDEPVRNTPQSTESAAVRPQTYKVDASELKLKPREAFEYKYRMEKGAGMVYAWKATGKVKYEFHGDADDPTISVVTYEKQENDWASGSLTAGFAGIHGWYFENPGDAEVTIAVNSAGFFSSAEELRPTWDPAKRKDRIEYVPHELSEPRK